MLADQFPDGRYFSARARVVAALPANSFACVMATGIVSIAAGFLGFAGIASVLLVVNAIAFLLLWALTLLRGSTTARL